MAIFQGLPKRAADEDSETCSSPGESREQVRLFPQKRVRTPIVNLRPMAS